MIKIRIAAAMLSAIVAGGFAASKNPSQAQTNRQTNKLAVVVAKAPTACKVEAYGFGLAGEPKTANVRAAPDKNAAILKSITTDDETVYSISGSDGKGWFEITKIEGVGDEEKTFFAGRGWVHSSNLDLSVAYLDPKLRSSPSGKSRVIKTLIADESEARPLACSGDWMQVKSGKAVGWLSRDGQCANPLTTCS